MAIFPSHSHFLLGDEIFCDFRHLPVTRFRRFMKCWPCHLISIDLAQHQILSYRSLEIMKTYLTEIFWDIPPWAFMFRKAWSCPALGIPKRCILMFPVLLRALQNTQMDLLYSKRVITWLWWTIFSWGTGKFYQRLLEKQRLWQFATHILKGLHYMIL